MSIENGSKPQNIKQQVAGILRRGILEERWRGSLPGRDHLAKELNVSPTTIVRALAILQKEGLVAKLGPGRPLEIIAKHKDTHTRRKLTIILRRDHQRDFDFMVNLVVLLLSKGYCVEYAKKSLQDLHLDAKRVASYVEKTPTDAWLVVTGTHEILEYFATQPVPAFALFGVREELGIAGSGPDKTAAHRELVRRLLAYGHRRIVLLHSSANPEAIQVKHARNFIEDMKAAGIQTGAYHYPQWEDNPQGLKRCVDSLFAHTPPTAIICGSPMIYVAVREQLAAKRVVVPDDVSLACEDDDPAFMMCDPAVARLRWDSGLCTHHILAWLDKISMGIDERTAHYVKAELIDGGTIGPAPH